MMKKKSILNTILHTISLFFVLLISDLKDEVLRKSLINSLDNSYKTIINKIYHKESDFSYNEFKNFIKEHHVNISFKGFSKEDVAQKAAANQNNIKKQTSFEKLLNSNRSKLLKITNFYNSLKSKYKMTVNKSAWSNNQLVDKEIQILSAEYLVNIWAFWKENFFEEYTSKDLNKIIGKQSSLTTANSNNFNKATDWFIKKTKLIIELNKKIIDLIDITSELEDHDDTDDTSKNIDALNADYEKQIQKFHDFINKNEQELLKIKIYQNITRVLICIEDNKEDYKAISSSLIGLLDKLDNMSEVFSDRITKGLEIITKSYEYYQNNISDFSFLEERKTETYFYLLNIINLHLVLSLKEKNLEHLLDNVTTEFIDDVIKNVQQRLIKANEYVKDNHLTLSKLNFGNNQHSMDKTFHQVLFN
jgi:hypothetical protein